MHHHASSLASCITIFAYVIISVCHYQCCAILQSLHIIVANSPPVKSQRQCCNRCETGVSPHTIAHHHTTVEMPGIEPGSELQSSRASTSVVAVCCLRLLSPATGLSKRHNAANTLSQIYAARGTAFQLICFALLCMRCLTRVASRLATQTKCNSSRPVIPAYPL